ncbi:hypothetical protein UREOM_1320 [Ureaplasma sp. OM1]|uniref:Uncharacterized protein n=2 Tax=Ureaplasma ceti TaxID=3119530 RepID=A0ABP9U8J9_9BACT
MNKDTILSISSFDWKNKNVNYKQLYSALEDIFAIYRNYRFKCELKNSVSSSNNFLMHDCNYEAIQDYLNIIDMACNNLTPENKEVINLIFVKRLKYNETFYSKSVYYEKKKRATREFIGILINDYNTEKVFADLVNNVKPFLY